MTKISITNDPKRVTISVPDDIAIEKLLEIANIIMGWNVTAPTESHNRKPATPTSTKPQPITNDTTDTKSISLPDKGIAIVLMHGEHVAQVKRFHNDKTAAFDYYNTNQHDEGVRLVLNGVTYNHEQAMQYFTTDQRKKKTL